MTSGPHAVSHAGPHAGGPLLTAGVPLAGADRAVVLLHGRGASARDILALAPELHMPRTIYLAPEAAGHTWYPRSFLAPRDANEPYLSSALARVESILQSLEQSGIGRERVLLAGFSQGACLATEFVAGHPTRYAGLIAFTGGLIGPPDHPLTRSDAQHGTELAGTPALFLSGDPDPHVPWSRVEESAAILRNMGASVTTHRFPGRAHTITAEELQLARELLSTIWPR